MSGTKNALYIFIPGKNWRLSLAELSSFFGAREYEFKVTDLSESFFVIASQRLLHDSLIDELGGMIKVGRVISQIPSKTVEDAVLRRKKQAQAEVRENVIGTYVIDDTLMLSRKKCVFGVSLYLGDQRLFRFSKMMQRFIGSQFKKEMLAQGIKARFLGFPKRRKLPQLTHVEVLKKGLTKESTEILFCIGKRRTYMAKTIAVHDPFEFQKRDVKRPVQRRIFSIPPRLAKIMLNLALCSPGKSLLDPFCGVGTILQEAMLMKAQVAGIDMNPWCVKASCTNLEWLKNEYNLRETKCRVLLGDSRKLTDHVREETVDGVVTEPDLGPALRHLPTEAYSRRIIEKLKPLYHDFLEGASKILKNGGYLVLVTPYIKTRGGTFVSLDIKEKAKTAGFDAICPIDKGIFINGVQSIEALTKMTSFIDMEKRHKVAREIHIFRKRDTAAQRVRARILSIQTDSEAAKENPLPQTILQVSNRLFLNQTLPSSS